MPYYHDLVTQKSFQELQNLQRNLDFVLIGGWATYMYTKSLKSKDIDIVVNFDQLPKIEKLYSLSKNDRLKKYEAVKDEVQIDIYLPFFSELGIPAEILVKNVENIDGFKVLDMNYLVALKIYTHHKRGNSVKGRKDFIDILSLILTDRIDNHSFTDLIQKFNFLKELDHFNKAITENTKIPELELNPHKYAVLKKNIKALSKGIIII